MVDRRLDRDADGSADLLGRFPETAAVWLPGGRSLAAGSHDAVARAGGDARSLCREGRHRRSPRDRSLPRSSLRRDATAVSFVAPILPPIARCGGSRCASRHLVGRSLRCRCRRRGASSSARPAVCSSASSGPSILASARTGTTSWPRCGVVPMPIAFCSEIREPVWRARRSCWTAEWLDFRADRDSDRESDSVRPGSDVVR